ncbi:AraC family transcriptional regulator [Paraburkholderia sp. A3BS-1L]|uniref:AraC family transcriptional regulator n=1 Tax=Paraburkholderia sp. A3BS-1L TaxID=3028375 RepID=UPI003DA83056
MGRTTKAPLSQSGEPGSLAGLIERFAPYDGRFDLPVAGVHVMRASSSCKELVHGVQKPCLCFAVQGSKTIMSGKGVYEYDEAHMLVYGVEVPVAGKVNRASPSAPFLCFRLDLDAARLASLSPKVFPHGLPKISEYGAIQIGPLDAAIVDASTRLLESMAKPHERDLLGPIIIDEILMRLLLGPLGSRIAQIGHEDSTYTRIAKAITWIRENYMQSFTVEEMARSVHMSASTFHNHFKSTTSMSPLQYQKVLRLQEARRLMLSTKQDVAGTSKAVGYVSVSQFSREYSRMFGDAPKRDITRLRQQAFETRRLAIASVL